MPGRCGAGVLMNAPGPGRCGVAGIWSAMVGGGGDSDVKQRKQPWGELQVEVGRTRLQPDMDKSWAHTG